MPAEYRNWRALGQRVGAGAILETLSGGTAIVSGTVTNGGTLFASGLDSLIQIAGGAHVSGGTAVVGDGIVAIAASGSTENVSFMTHPVMHITTRAR